MSKFKSFVIFDPTSTSRVARYNQVFQINVKPFTSFLVNIRTVRIHRIRSFIDQDEGLMDPAKLRRV
ncbi:hypothetical protein BOTNAR_0220g00190 [Botryotinia narcissicola]|uniref:Uncharacterized protein n=1 Tax=Botryotinia narcissicola TaxID=278944 RepID=A0A4Z1ICB2_9HELO|nr:hypothetical protein BOTNAR_0220g00190 [Botryotinia narcissicola]